MSNRYGLLSAMLTSLPGDFIESALVVARLGFTHVDVVALADRPVSHLEVLAETGLVVHCASIGVGLPPGCALDAIDINARRDAMALMQRQISDAARLGATRAYVIPPAAEPQENAPLRERAFAEAVQLLADHAAGQMVRLCVEHFPGRLLPTVAATLEWLERLNHPQLSLLLDVGHCLISKEAPAEAARQAGTRLGYVHLDDNDGSQDLHWPLFTGQLTETHLTDLATALGDIRYTGGLSLELAPTSADPCQALADGKALADRIF